MLITEDLNNNFEFSNDNSSEEITENSTDAKISEDDNKPKNTLLKDIFDWFDVVVTSLIAVVLIFSFGIRIATIDGSSMENTLFEGERVVLSNFLYQPKQGDIVIVSRNYENDTTITDPKSKPIIKRIIAVGGQKVDIDFEAGIVYVDDKPIDDSYTKTPTNQRGDVQFPVYVPEGCVFVLGDNRNESLDSRYSVIGDMGMVDERYILGHVLIRIFPFNKFGEV